MGDQRLFVRAGAVLNSQSHGHLTPTLTETAWGEGRHEVESRKREGHAEEAREAVLVAHVHVPPFVLQRAIS